MKYFTFLLAFLFYAEIVFGQAGKIDSSFGINGAITLHADYSAEDFPYYSNVGLAIQNDGKLLLSISGTDTNSHNRIFRFSSDGIPDSSFGKNGVVATMVNSTNNHNIAIQPDGKILICGNNIASNNNIGVIQRFNSNGTVDSSFNGNGLISMLSNGEGFTAIAVSQDRIVAVGGSDGVYKFAIRSFDYSGVPDLSFNKTGKLIFHLGRSDDYNSPNAVQIDSLDEITVGGDISYGSGIDSLVVIKVLKNGSFDQSFNNTGFFYLTHGSQQRVTDMKLDRNGKTIVTGYYWNYKYYLFVLRLTAFGTLDTSFAGEGIYASSLLYGYVESLALDESNKILCATTLYDVSTNILHVLNEIFRLNDNGHIDSTFGISGVSLADIGDNADNVTAAIAVEEDGKIILAGQSEYPTLIDYLFSFFGNNITTGTLDFSKPANSIIIYPNPIHSTETLRYSLTQDENVSIDLYDISGRLVQSFFSNQKRTADEHSEELNFAPSLNAAAYVLVISNGKNNVSIKVVKQ